MTSTLNPQVDIAFKKIFGVEENKDLLISLINSVVSEEDQICEVDILNPYNLQNFRHDKLSIVDVKARGKNQKHYHIEMQIMDEGDYDKRALHSWAKAYAEQIGNGQHYRLLNKTIGIHILNFLSVPESQKYHNVFHLREQDYGFRYFCDMEMHTIELKKFEQKEPGKKTESLSKQEELDALMLKVKTGLDRWIAFLTRHDLLDKTKLPKAVDTPDIKKALNVLEAMNLSKDEREAYEAHLKWLRVEESTLSKARDEGEVKGRAEGLAEGEAKGRAEGLAEGRALEQRRVAQSMIRAGVDALVIAQVTKLTQNEIELLREGLLEESDS